MCFTPHQTFIMPHTKSCREFDAINPKTDSTRSAFVVGVAILRAGVTETYFRIDKTKECAVTLLSFPTLNTANQAALDFSRKKSKG